jgi:hypothetical protein
MAKKKKSKETSFLNMPHSLMMLPPGIGFLTKSKDLQITIHHSLILIMIHSLISLHLEVSIGEAMTAMTLTLIFTLAEKTYLKELKLALTIIAMESTELTLKQTKLIKNFIAMDKTTKVLF